MGEQIYEGRVYALDGRPAPLYRYERRIYRHADTVVSTHLTYDPAGHVVVMQSAGHTPQYEVHRADMVHAQSGVAAALTVAAGRAVFTLDDHGNVSTATEAVSDPIVTGPTMFGYILAHWDRLVAGDALRIRFAVLERTETIGFVLDRVQSKSPGRTTIRMKASNPLVRLAIAPTYFEFDTPTRRILEYTGRVPPFEVANHRLQTLDARVAYRFVAPEFQ